jgi:uncharacterized protein YjiK
MKRLPIHLGAALLAAALNYLPSQLTTPGQAIRPDPCAVGVDAHRSLLPAHRCPIRVIAGPRPRARLADSTSTVSPTISTVAGNLSRMVRPPTALAIHPQGVASAGARQLLVADPTHRVVWLANLSSITATVYGQVIPAYAMAIVAGTGAPGSAGDGRIAASAQLGSPMGLAVDDHNNLYIADVGNHRVRKVWASSGLITTVAGNGTAGFGGDDGPATAAQLNAPYGVALDVGGNLYIADTENHRVRKVWASSGVITTVAGTGASGYKGDGGPATAAQLNAPRGIAVDAGGNLYIADTFNHRVRKVWARGGTISTAMLALGGTISTVAGTGSAGYSGDGGSAVAAQLASPNGVALDAIGNLYIADTDNDRVREVRAGSGIIVTAQADPLSSPAGVALDADNTLYIADTYNNRVRALRSGSLAIVAGNGSASYSGDGGPATTAQLYNPRGVATDAAGNLYVADSDNNRVREVQAGSGIITTVAGTGTRGYSGDNGPANAAALNHPLSVALDSLGNLYIVDSFNQRVREVHAADGTITTVAGTGISGFSGDGGPANVAQLNYPSGIAVDAGNNVYIADSNNSRVRKVWASNGTITTVAGIGTYSFGGDGGPATSAQLNFPMAVATDDIGNLYIADSGNYRVRKVLAGSGTITTVAGTGTSGYSGDGGPAASAQLNYPMAVATDDIGNLYIADSGNNVVREVQASNAIIATVAGDGTAGYGGNGGPATAAQLHTPAGVALDVTGNLYIADEVNYRVRKVDSGSSAAAAAPQTGGSQVQTTTATKTNTLMQTG